jgi:hypothetical protein
MRAKKEIKVPDMLVALDLGNSVDLNSVESRRSRRAMSQMGIMSERVETADLLGEDDASGDDDGQLQKLVVEESELKLNNLFEGDFYHVGISSHNRVIFGDFMSRPRMMKALFGKLNLSEFIRSALDDFVPEVWRGNLLWRNQVPVSAASQSFCKSHAF